MEAEAESAKQKKRVYARAYYLAHKEERRAYYWAHKEERRAYGRAYARTYNPTHREERQANYLAHREERCAYDSEYRREHTEQVRLRKREYRETHSMQIREYRQSERGRALKRQRHNIRRAMKAGMPSTFTRLEWQNALIHFGNCCAYCGGAAKRLHQDHVVPLSMGGGYVAGNIVPACPRCNLSKHNAALGDWATNRGVDFLLPAAIARVMSYLRELGA